MSFRDRYFRDGDVVVIERAMFRGRFIVLDFVRNAGRIYAKLEHESNPHENCHVLISNLLPARGLLTPTYDPALTWHEICESMVAA